MIVLGMSENGVYGNPSNGDLNGPISRQTRLYSLGTKINQPEPMTGRWTEHCSPGKICQKFRRVPDGTYFFSAKSGLFTGSPLIQTWKGRWTNRLSHIRWITQRITADHRCETLQEWGTPIQWPETSYSPWILLGGSKSIAFSTIVGMMIQLRYSHILRCLAQPPTGIAPFSIAWSPD